MQTNCLMRGTLAAETHTQSQTQSQSQSQLQPQAKTKAKGRKEEGSHPQTVFRGGGAVVGMPRQRKKDEQKEDVALGGELTFNNEIYIGNAPQTSNLLPKMIAWKRAAMSREDYRNMVGRAEEHIRQEQERPRDRPEEQYCTSVQDAEWDVCQEILLNEEGGGVIHAKNHTRSEVLAVIRVNKEENGLDDELVNLQDGDIEEELSELTGDANDMLITKDHHDEIATTFVENTFVANTEPERQRRMGSAIGPTPRPQRRYDSLNETPQSDTPLQDDTPMHDTYEMGKRWDDWNSLKETAEDAIGTANGHGGLAAPREGLHRAGSEDNENGGGGGTAEKKFPAGSMQGDQETIPCTKEAETLVPSTLAEVPGVLSLQAAENIVSDAVCGIVEETKAQVFCAREISPARPRGGQTNLRRRAVVTPVGDEEERVKETAPDSNAERDDEDPYEMRSTLPSTDGRRASTHSEHEVKTDRAAVGCTSKGAAGKSEDVEREHSDAKGDGAPSREGPVEAVGTGDAIVRRSGRSRRMSEKMKESTSSEPEKKRRVSDVNSTGEKAKPARCDSATAVGSTDRKDTLKRSLRRRRQEFMQGPVEQETKKAKRRNSKPFKGTRFLFSAFSGEKEKAARDSMMEVVEKNGGTVERSDDIRKYSSEHRYILVCQRMSKSWKTLYSLSCACPIVKPSWVKEVMKTGDVRGASAEHFWLDQNSALKSGELFSGLKFFLDSGGDRDWKEKTCFILENSGGERLVRLPHHNSMDENSDCIIALFEDLESKAVTVNNYKRRNIPSRDGSWVFDVLSGKETLQESLPMLLPRARGDVEEGDCQEYDTIEQEDDAEAAVETHRPAEEEPEEEREGPAADAGDEDAVDGTPRADEILNGEEHNDDVDVVRESPPPTDAQDGEYAATGGSGGTGTPPKVMSAQEDPDDEEIFGDRIVDSLANLDQRDPEDVQDGVELKKSKNQDDPKSPEGHGLTEDTPAHQGREPPVPRTRKSDFDQSELEAEQELDEKTVKTADVDISGEIDEKDAQREGTGAEGLDRRETRRGSLSSPGPDPHDPREEEHETHQGQVEDNGGHAADGFKGVDFVVVMKTLYSRFVFREEIFVVGDAIEITVPGGDGGDVLIIGRLVSCWQEDRVDGTKGRLQIEMRLFCRPSRTPYPLQNFLPGSADEDANVLYATDASKTVELSSIRTMRVVKIVHTLDEHRATTGTCTYLCRYQYVSRPSPLLVPWEWMAPYDGDDDGQ